MYELLISELKEKVNQLREKIRSYEAVISDLEASKADEEVKSSNLIPSVRNRIINTLKKHNGEFSRKRLMLETINDEININIPLTTFAPEFSRLVKIGEIICVKQPHGRKPGVYKRKE